MLFVISPIHPPKITKYLMHKKKNLLCIYKKNKKYRKTLNASPSILFIYNTSTYDKIIFEVGVPILFVCDEFKTLDISQDILFIHNIST